MWEEWRKGVYILTAVQFVMRVSITSIRPFVPLYLPEIGVSLPQQIAFWTGIATSANFFAQILTQPIWGSVADRYGYKTMVVRSVFAVGFFNVALIWASSVNQFVLVRFFMGLMSGFTAASITFVAVTSPGDKLGYSVGLLQAGQMAGTILGPGVGGVFAELFGYKGTFLFSGLIGLAMVPLIIFGIKYNPVKEMPENSLRFSPETRKAGIKALPAALAGIDKLIIVMLVIIACTQFGTQSSDSFIAIFIREIYSGDRINLVVALSYALAASAALLAAPLFGTVGDRYGHRHILHISLIGMAAAVGLQTFCANVQQLIILRVLSGIFAAGILPSAYAIIGSLAGEGRKGRIFGIAGSATAIGNLSGPLFGGIIASVFSLRTVFWTTAVVIIAVEIFSQAYRNRIS
ncbi:MAG TPA: MFS transporter [Anaerovoracaceae bacterium]|nr:MFS transporter [Anaerovoracaceae bacterium]